ncbi:unnamed protein product [Protopolystoma xenopodis]|uniref:GST N-terminal domain-containing protein n=1 Tax=Protopolystoma xenopodis TaxID=117903 RepID=A0A448WGM9_9PLAT|nr:unnamed protein product [Protopolystoma xenopodis]
MFTDEADCDTCESRLIYFNLRGRGELIRLVFATGGLKLEQVRMDLGDWTKMKPLMKTGQVPTLEVTKSNGEIEQLSESGAIVRALARMLGMMGDSDRDYYNIEKALGQK